MRMLLDRKLLAKATEQFTKYVDMNDGFYDRLPKSQYGNAYGFTAYDAVNLSSPCCILPMLIKQYEETSFYCAANDEFYMHIALYDDIETSKWQYSIFMVLAQIHKEYAKKIYEPTRYIDASLYAYKPDTKLIPCGKLAFSSNFGADWNCVISKAGGIEDDLALSSEIDLFVKELAAALNRCITSGKFVEENIRGFHIWRKGHFRSMVRKRFGVYQIDVDADKPFAFHVTIYKKP
jgi:hypothetical protein